MVNYLLPIKTNIFQKYFLACSWPKIAFLLRPIHFKNIISRPFHVKPISSAPSFQCISYWAAWTIIEMKNVAEEQKTEKNWKENFFSGKYVYKLHNEIGLKNFCCTSSAKIIQFLGHKSCYCCSMFDWQLTALIFHLNLIFVYIFYVLLHQNTSNNNAN
jgi:hypothetical protein